MKMYFFVVLISLLAFNSVASSSSVENENGRTAKGEEVLKIEEVFANRENLKGKRITIKGDVVKFNSAIMGKNWVHIQDGTGKPGSNDLTVTTNDYVSVGDNVVVTGIVVVDKDLGAGYKYTVIIEDAVISPQ